MKPQEGVLYVVEVKSGLGGQFTPLLGRVCISRRTGQEAKRKAEMAFPQGTKFRVVKYVREGGAQ